MSATELLKLKMTWEYIAGFFDGEGTIAKFNNGICHYAIAITQANEEVLQEIKKFLKFGHVYVIKKRKVNWKDAWILRISDNRQVLFFLKNVLPFLIVKRDKATKTVLILKDYIDNKKRHGISEENLKKAIKFYKSGLGYKLSTKKVGIYSQRESFRDYLQKNNLMRK